MKKKRLNSKNPKYNPSLEGKKIELKLIKQIICCDKKGVKGYANWYKHE